MASSNRHWPSMFKSKPCSNHHQCLHDINSVNPSCLVSSAPCQKSPYTPAPACEERSPEPKPRWNPKPEQIRILEAIFNSGMVNPPRDEIRKIRAQLQEYGQVGDANVFYWFQNRKSRSKHKLRTAATTARSQPRTSASPAASVLAITANSSSSSSSERSTGSEKNPPPPVMVSMSGSPTASVNQTYFPCPVDFCGDSFILQGPQYYISASELTGAFGPGEPATGVSPGMWSELMLHNVSSVTTTSVSPLAATTAANVATSGNEIQGLGTPAAAAPSRSTVFINEVVYDVLPNPLNVRELFGDEAVLFHSNGNRVPVDEWGTTLQPLQHGASYYLF